MQRILSSHYHAHLACCDGQEPYLVPISYAYHDGSLYGYTHEGRKIEILRKNPSVCVEVDDIHADNWRSVIVRGVYQELSGDERVEAIRILGDKISTPPAHDKPAFIHHELVGQGAQTKSGPIIYRINVSSMTGRGFGQWGAD